jgi:hypothetical protein
MTDNPRRFSLASTPLLRSRKGDIKVEGDPFPEVSTEPEFYGFNPNLPAVNTDDNVFTLLREIRDLLQYPNPVEPFYFNFWRDIPNTLSGQLEIQAYQEFNNIWIAKAPRTLNIYAGIGASLFLGSITVGKSLRAQLPFPVNAVTIEWVAAAAGQQIGGVLSSDPMKIEIIG